MLRNGFHTYFGLRQAVSSSHWPPSILQAHQFQLWKSLLCHAYSHVPFYKQHFDEHGFHPRQFQSLDDTSRIPFLDKQQFIQASPSRLLTSGLNPDQCLRISTSGSTGQPLSIFLSENGHRAQRVAAWRILFEHGFRWTDHTLEIRITCGDTYPIQSFGFAPKTWLSALDPPSVWLREMQSIRPEVLVACPSVLRALAAECDATTHRPRLVFSDSETLYPNDRSLILQRLGSDPIDVYGLVELSNFAWECETRNGFHVSADTHYIEIINNELVVTQLNQTDMPVIRYRTGDCAAWSESPCACGRTLPLLSRIEGRALDSVELPSGRNLFWPFFHEALAPFTCVRQWRVTQTDPGAIALELATESHNLPEIEAALSQLLPEPLSIQTKALQLIPIEPGTKFRAVRRIARPQ